LTSSKEREKKKKFPKKKFPDMTQEKIRMEIQEIALSVALMLTEREVAANREMSEDIKDVVESHREEIEQALWDLHHTIKSAYND